MIVFLDAAGKFISLGKLVGPVSYDDTQKAIILKYENGDVCGTSQIAQQSTIIFKCKPGKSQDHRLVFSPC